MRKSLSTIYLQAPVMRANTGVHTVSLSIHADGEPLSDSSDSDTPMWAHVGCGPLKMPRRGVREAPPAERGSAVGSVLGWSPDSYSLFQSGEVYTARFPVRRHSSGGYGPGDIITVRLDTNTGSLYFGVTSVDALATSRSSSSSSSSSSSNR